MFRRFITSIEDSNYKHALRVNDPTALVRYIQNYSNKHYDRMDGDFVIKSKENGNLVISNKEGSLMDLGKVALWLAVRLEKDLEVSTNTGNLFAIKPQNKYGEKVCLVDGKDIPTERNQINAGVEYAFRTKDFPFPGTEQDEF